MNIISFIPARNGSKGIIGKNIKILGDKPLIVWSIETSLDCGLRTIVNTDGGGIGEIALRHGAEVMMRSKELGQDNTPMLEVLQREIPKIEPLPDIVMLLQPTVPFRKKTHIKLAIEMLKKYWDDYDSVISVERVPEKYHPMVAFISTPAGKRMLFAKAKSKLKVWWTGKKYEGPVMSGYPISQRVIRRQDYPEAWVPTGSVYLFKTSNLKGGSIYGDKVMLLETESYININTPDDWKEAEQWVQKL